VATACGSPQGSGSGGSGQTISLYYVAPLTGDGDVTGIAGCDGEQLAVSDINAAGGVAKGPLKGAKFKVQCLDDRNSSAQDSSLATKYVSDSSIWAMGGFYASGNALAAALVAQRSNLVILAANVAADFLTTQVHNVYVLNPTLESAGAAASEFCHDYYGATRIAALNPNYSYIQGYMDGAKAGISSEGLSLVADETWPDGQTTNWGPYLTKIEGASADCVLLGGYPPEQCQIARQARQLGSDVPVIDLTESYTSASCQKEAGPFYPGLIFGNLLPPTTSKSSLDAKVAAAYQGRFKTDFTYQAAQAYNCVLAVKYAIEAGARDRTQLISYLAKVSGPGVGGPVAFTNKRVGIRYLTFQEVTQNGSLQGVAEYEMHPNGTVKRVFVDKCGDRPSCQTRLGASA
jgi:branched-chain amino acid transport system substrate-binding protein